MIENYFGDLKMIDSSRYRALYISQITSEFMGIMFMNANDLMEDQVMT
jgi:hypothetical protein